MIHLIKRLLICSFVLSAVLSCLPCYEEPAPEYKLEPAFYDSIYQLTGVAVSKTGRLFVCYPLWSDTYQYALVEILPGNKKQPYPNEEMNTWGEGDDGMKKWVCVQAVYIDDEDMMWVVDPASPYMKGVYNNSHKLVKIDLASNKVVRTYSFRDVADSKSYINDVRVDVANQFAYLTNSSEGGIVVIDLKTGKAKQVLQQSSSVHTDSSYQFIVDGHELYKDGEPYKVQSDGIALSPDNAYLYYKPLTDNKLYRIATNYLRSDSLSGSELNNKVEFVGNFATTDGMIFTKSGDLVLGDIQNYRLIKITPDLKMKELIKSNLLIWPDSYSINSTTNELYVSCSQIQKQPDMNNGMNRRTSYYMVFKIKLED